ncbi:paREP2a [Pyrobaculum aerophilum str. IM2]|uniref:PaREP2a n=2 Tax=Pyrobaculum aerophilum TaxID=13773 RepID=Q8ZWX7_PYRAE|nr:PaRep2a protein [Pyrobaculum aerophilum]AAL63572.1 paREP2a [Pyrobaculum aerophilum str. IM2]
MTVKAVKAACVKVALPEAFSLPRKFGVSWGCFTQGAFYGVDAVVAEGGVKGLYFRYVLPYDAIAKRYLAVYKRREEREEGSYRLPQYFADALYELAAKYEVELAQDAVYVNGVEVDKWLCKRPTAEGCVRGIVEFLKSPPREALKSQKAWRELRRELYRAVAQWHRQCFGREPMGLIEGIVKRLEEYVAMCQLYKAIKRELGGRASLYASDFSLRRAFWWDGEWMGAPASCLIVAYEAFCQVGSAKLEFSVHYGEDGVYLEPKIPLYQDRIKVAHRGDGDA